MVVRISDKTQNYSKVTKLLVKPKEKYWGNKLQAINKQEAYTDFEFYTDDMSNLYQSLFSMSDQMELLNPEDVKIAYLSRVQKILNAYRDEKN
jgi:predicted DNA-binding transcriptional regulator YafY